MIQVPSYIKLRAAVSFAIAPLADEVEGMVQSGEMAAAAKGAVDMPEAAVRECRSARGDLHVMSKALQLLAQLEQAGWPLTLTSDGKRLIVPSASRLGAQTYVTTATSCTCDAGVYRHLCTHRVIAQACSAVWKFERDGGDYMSLIQQPSAPVDAMPQGVTTQHAVPYYCE